MLSGARSGAAAPGSNTEIALSAHRDTDTQQAQITAKLDHKFREFPCVF